MPIDWNVNSGQVWSSRLRISTPTNPRGRRGSNGSLGEARATIHGDRSWLGEWRCGNHHCNRSRGSGQICMGGKPLR